MDNISYDPVPDNMVPINATAPVETSKSNNATVILNVGGMKHETYVNTLKSIPGTRLADLETLAPHFRPEAGDYFFDRHPQIFTAILNYYRTGVLHVPQDMCMAIMRSELKYWEIDEVRMEDCCWVGYRSQKDAEEKLSKFGLDKKSQEEAANNKPAPPNTKLGHFRAAVWEGLEVPFSSTPAKVYTVITILVTLVSIFTLCAGTHHAFRHAVPMKNNTDLPLVSHTELKHDPEHKDYQYNFTHYNHDHTDDYHDQNKSKAGVPVQNPTMTTGPQHDQQTSPQYANNPAKKKRNTQENNIRFLLNQILELNILNEKRSKRSVIGTTTPTTSTARHQEFHTPYYGLVVTDYVCYAFFTLELIIRFIFCPSKFHFFINSMTWLDMICLVPYYIELILNDTLGDGQGSLVNALTALRVFRVFRIMRIFRFNAGLRVFAYTLQSSIKDMLVMVTFLITAVLFFGCLIYYADQASGTFESVPDATWWAIVTMTTVGYGDIAPETIIGRFIGSVCAICGVMVLGFTIPVIVGNFMTFYGFISANRN